MYDKFVSFYCWVGAINAVGFVIYSFWLTYGFYPASKGWYAWVDSLNFWEKALLLLLSPLAGVSIAGLTVGGFAMIIVIWLLNQIRSR